MNRLLILCSVLICFSTFSQTKEKPKEITIKGINYGKSLIVENPFREDGVGYSLYDLLINNLITVDEINKSIFEIDLKSDGHLYKAKVGDSIKVTLQYFSKNAPRFINPESILDPNIETIAPLEGYSGENKSFYLADKTICLISGKLGLDSRIPRFKPDNSLAIWDYYTELYQKVNDSLKLKYTNGASGKYLFIAKFDYLYELWITEKKTRKPIKKILIDLRGIPENQKRGQVINFDLLIPKFDDAREANLYSKFPINKLHYSVVDHTLKWDEDYANAVSSSYQFLSNQISQEKNLKEVELDRAIKALALNKSKNELTIKILENNKNKSDILTKSLEIDKQKSELEKQSLDKKIKEKELKEKSLLINQEQKQKKYLYGIISIIVIITIGSIFAFFRQRKLRKLIDKQKIEVEEQKHLVEEKQKEIVDSISYAKRLQEAILPPQEFVNTHLANNFIYYQPKDIVAGDFYWAEKVGEKFFIAAADSTGHGVPGAMVSVVCSNALNRTIKEFKLTETGKILDKTRELVLETFEKSASEVKDGMDISLLCIDSKNKNIFWSGANNPLWYIQDNELKEIKADKQPIGKTDYPKPFTTHQIEYKENTTFYLFTDGLADQFGGPNGKKFKYKQFSDLLIKNNNLSQKQQADIIDKAFSDWKGDLEQVDDVCVIGVKL